MKRWGDILLQPLARAVGTALLRATAFAMRTPPSLPDPARNGAIAGGQGEEVQGEYALFLASVARVNRRPTMRVANVSVTVFFAAAAGDDTVNPGGSSSAAPQTHVEIFASDLSAGAPEENLTQTLSLTVVRITNPVLFARPPRVAVVPASGLAGQAGAWLGQISFDSAPWQLGVSQVAVVLQDSGGRIRSSGGRAVGHDTSIEYWFEVRVVAGYIPPAFVFRPGPPIVVQEGLPTFSKEDMVAPADVKVYRHGVLVTDHRAFVLTAFSYEEESAESAAGTLAERLDRVFDAAPTLSLPSPEVSHSSVTLAFVAKPKIHGNFYLSFTLKDLSLTPEEEEQVLTASYVSDRCCSS